MSDRKENPLYEFTHKSGLRIRVPKGFSLDGHPPDGRVVQLVEGDRHVSFNVALIEDVAAYINTLSWHERNAMTPVSPEWPSFHELLLGKEGINLTPELSPYDYNCACRERPEERCWDGKKILWPKSKKILETYFPSYDIHNSFTYWDQVVANCDCEVAFNVDVELHKNYFKLMDDHERWCDKQHTSRKKS